MGRILDGLQTIRDRWKLSRLLKHPTAGPEMQLQRMLASPDDAAATPRAYAQTWNGEKFAGGMFDNFGAGHQMWTDYYLLRARSEEVFQRNLYARGLIKRLVTNEIHTGLALEATPAAKLLGRTSEGMLDWSEDVELRFRMWAKSAKVCDHSERRTFGQIQGLVRREALVGGDCLVVQRQHPVTKLPTIECVPARNIGGGFTDETPNGNVVIHGVEVDAAGRHVAFHVWSSYDQRAGTSQRIPAFDEAGRRTAWMVYGSDLRTHTVRGEPLLGIVLQSLKEIDKYRDSAQRKAVINSILAMFIRKGQDKMSSLPMSGAAVLTGEVSPGLAGGATTTPRNFSLADQIPGVVFEELQQGEEPVGFDNRGTDTAFPVFEASIISAIAWTQEIPPEILTLSFNSNYSASQAALNEFRIYLELRRVDFGEQSLSHVYSDWLLSEVLRGRVDAASLPAAAANLERFDIAAAWTCADWTGAIKPTTDPLKAVRAATEASDAGLMTREYASATLYGRHFEQNAKVLGRENQTLADINAPLADAAGEILTPDTDTDEDEPDVDDNDEDGEPANEEDE